MSLLRSDANTHVVYNVGQFLRRNVKKICLREEYELTQDCLKPILTLSCSYLNVNFA